MGIWRWGTGDAALGSLAAYIAVVAHADAPPARCDDPGFMVAAGDEALRGTICSMAPDIRDALVSCGLEQTRPLTIEIVPGFDHPIGVCLASFDCAYDLVRITDPARYGEVTGEDRIYAELPADIALRALLTHELTHAFVAQSAGDRSVEIVDQEYVAAAMELELMEEVWRAEYIAATPVSLPPKPGLIDIWIYGMAPRKFAVNAWQHFSLPENGCPLIGRILTGEVSFSAKVHPERR